MVKKRNAQDSTRRNTQATNKKIAKLKQGHIDLKRRVRDIEKKLRIINKG